MILIKGEDVTDHRRSCALLLEPVLAVVDRIAPENARNFGRA